MPDAMDYLRLQEAAIPLNLAIAAFLIVTLTLRFLVRRGSVKFHYFFLLASSVFALIEYAVAEGVHNIVDPSGLTIAYIILDSLSAACIGLTAVLALRQFTVSYLKGPSSIVDFMIGVAALACIVGVVIAGIYGRGLTYGSTTIKTFGLIALYIVGIFVYYLYVVIESYLPTLDNGDIDITKSYSLLVADEVLGAVLFRLSALLFVFFYDKLSVMEPVPFKRDTYEEHEV
ncbi:unnamed protein product [Umbelopsis ramanniana]